MSINMIRWLHISDLHLGSDGAVTAMLRDELPSFLKSKGLKCDYVFCTGDIRTANVNPNDFTDDMAAFLKQVCEAVGITIERLFIVPGNHDINRDVAGRAEAIEGAMWGKNFYYNSDDGIIKPEDISKIMSGEIDFKSFLEKVYPQNRIDYYGKIDAPHFNIETDDFNILHVDTTVAYTKGHEAYDLVVGTNYLYNVIRSLNKRKPTILLAHYPYDCLRQSEKKVLSTMLQHNDVRLWLAGHEHDKLLKKEQYLDVLQAGELRKEDKTSPSFLIGEYEPTTFDCKVTAYMWYPEGWEKYPYVDLDNTPQDVYNFKLFPAEKEKQQVSDESMGADVQKIAEAASSLASEIGKLVNNPAIQNANIVLGGNQAQTQVVENTHIVERKQLVERCTTDLKSGKLVVLHGSLKIGKSELARQIEKTFPGIAVYDNTLLDKLEGKIDTLLRENRNGQAVVVTTSALNLNFAGFDTAYVSQIEVPLMTLAETKDLISTYNPTKDLSSFIWAHSCGHPVLIKTLCDYLSANNWTINEANFSDVLNFSFDYSLPRSIASLMGKLIPDKQNRAFLNRLLLVKGSFTETEACGLASIEPQIDEPMMRLNSLIPSWIMPIDGLLKTNPLFDKVWKPDVPQSSSASCHRLLASNILHKNGALGEHDVLRYIAHCVTAGDYEDAGVMYITVMLKIHDADGLPERSIFRGIWIDIPLPTGMSLHTRIGIRIIQLIYFQRLKKIQRQYLLNDLASLVSQCSDKMFLPFFNSVITMFSFLDGDTKIGLEHYNQYLKYKEDGAEMLKLVEDSIPIFDNNIWFFLLRAEKPEDYSSWLNSFDPDRAIYSHDDIHICDSCYLSVNRFIDYHLQSETIVSRIQILQIIQKQAEEKQCPEIAIVCIFKQMELLARDFRYSEARDVYSANYHQYEEYPLAQILLNGSMANAHYRDNAIDNKEAIPYFKAVLSVKNEDLIPDIRSHMQQLYSYVIAEDDEEAGVAMLEDALKFVDNDKHRVDIYEYYQCAGELSYAYWCAGNRVKAVEMLSSCVSFVLTDLKDGSSKFAKSYLCICDCLAYKYQFDLENKALPESQAKPFHGMFSEKGLTDFDDLYSEDRIYTTSYMMCGICGKLGMKELATKWAYKTVEACKDRKDVQETHYLIFLLLPLFIAENDLEAIRYVINHSCQAKMLSYNNHPELKKDNADFEFIEFHIVSLLMAALSLKLRGDESGLELIKEILGEYTPVTDAEMIDKMRSIFGRSAYDKAFISEINELDQNRYYAVYVCAYLLTAFYSDAYYAFMLLIAVLPSLEKHFMQILGKEAITIVNRFIADLWKAKILNSPDEFSDYKRLYDKGLPLIDEYEGKDNLGNHTMFMVQYHLKGKITLQPEQEKWLEA